MSWCEGMQPTKFYDQGRTENGIAVFKVNRAMVISRHPDRAHPPSAEQSSTVLAKIGTVKQDIRDP